MATATRKFPSGGSQRHTTSSSWLARRRSTATPHMGFSIPSKKFKILGRPQIENIETVTTPISTVDNPVVLYAPTWYAADYKNNHSSLPIGTAIVSALLARNATVIFRPHPARRKLPESAAAIAAIQKLLQADAKATTACTPLGRSGGQAQLCRACQRGRCDGGRRLRSRHGLHAIAEAVRHGCYRGRHRDVSEPASPPAVLRTSSSGICRRLTMRSMPCWAPIRSQLSASERRKYYLGGYDNGESARAFVSYLQSLAAPRPAKSAPVKLPLPVQIAQKPLQPAGQ